MDMCMCSILFSNHLLHKQESLPVPWKHHYMPHKQESFSSALEAPLHASQAFGYDGAKEVWRARQKERRVHTAKTAGAWCVGSREGQHHLICISTCVLVKARLRARPAAGVPSEFLSASNMLRAAEIIRGENPTLEGTDAHRSCARTLAPSARAFRRHQRRPGWGLLRTSEVYR